MSEIDFLAEAAKKHQLNKNQIIALLGEDRHEKELFAAADAVRKDFVGGEVHLRAASRQPQPEALPDESGRDCRAGYPRRSRIRV